MGEHTPPETGPDAETTLDHLLNGHHRDLLRGVEGALATDVGLRNLAARAARAAGGQPEGPALAVPFPADLAVPVHPPGYAPEPSRGEAVRNILRDIDNERRFLEAFAPRARGHAATLARLADAPADVKTLGRAIGDARQALEHVTSGLLANTLGAADAAALFDRSLTALREQLVLWRTFVAAPDREALARSRSYLHLRRGLTFRIEGMSVLRTAVLRLFEHSAVHPR
ncbi:hypothetical protein [Streptomyces sp. RerS4]|uniref:hypothetical protein n=1 Tax=Streptomyces sp. RerS4 TaxID=2942449 RepID=UPI00201C4914|nr:hypothetical protein [Streptomyces sp. RerS4]UQX04412.1 hypothetical protein M4D82_30835 [Streptomyces sp. RerS4]